MRSKKAVIEVLKKEFPGIEGIRVSDDGEGILLGNAAEGGQVDGDYAAVYGYDGPPYVNQKLKDEIDKLGYWTEWRDAGSLMAYPK